MNGGGSKSLRSALSYCVQQVRNYGYHHYLCLLELPPEMRKAAFALRAFNVETARAMDVAPDPEIGSMRLLWWQEAIDKLYIKKHPEVEDIPESIEELERYAEDTVSTLLYNTLQAGGISSTAVDHAASHIGGRSEILLDVNSREGFCNVVFEIASVANVHLLKARELAGKVPAEAKPVLLHSVPVQVLLYSLSKVHFDVFDLRIQRGVFGVSPLWFQYKFKWYSWRAMF
ncbi:hypothetical protein EUTSA_v10029515mg [Eutrema salsugineum]|uniref:Uncharacterized protein n=1 Tax=Eutrema salsugineum TaxID=72664 RepID=V4LF49_EUTSA|nr:hypothetical protein EUTSA_v10029515mg [Eutrema salsugineum]